MSDHYARAIAVRRRQEVAALVREMNSPDPAVRAKAPATRSTLDELDGMMRRRQAAVDGQAMQRRVHGPFKR